MRIMSLFAGIGGFDLAASWMGWQTVVMVEWDKQRQKWLKELYPDADIHGDIDIFDNTAYRGSIDLICGGEPCQGNSVAGKRKGNADSRFKWPQYLRQVKEIRPAWVVNENVSGSISNGVLDRKISDLEAIGYSCWPPLLIPASAVGCHHRRDRIFLIAYSLRTGFQKFNSAAVPERQTPGNVRDGAERPAAFRGVARYANTSEVVRAANGLSSGIPANIRNKAIESFGNAVVPQVVYQLFQAINMAKSFQIH